MRREEMRELDAGTLELAIRCALEGVPRSDLGEPAQVDQVALESAEGRFCTSVLSQWGAMLALGAAPQAAALTVGVLSFLIGASYAEMREAQRDLKAAITEGGATGEG